LRLAGELPASDTRAEVREAQAALLQLHMNPQIGHRCELGRAEIELRQIDQHIGIHLRQAGQVEALVGQHLATLARRLIGAGHWCEIGKRQTPPA
jgi:hypothetical protein